MLAMKIEICWWHTNNLKIKKIAVDASDKLITFKECLVSSRLSRFYVLEVFMENTLSCAVFDRFVKYAVVCEQISLHLGGYLSDKEVIVSRLFLQVVLLQLGLVFLFVRNIFSQLFIGS
jgi:hypothetical protein